LADARLVGAGQAADALALREARIQVGEEDALPPVSVRTAQRQLGEAVPPEDGAFQAVEAAAIVVGGEGGPRGRLLDVDASRSAAPSSGLPAGAPGPRSAGAIRHAPLPRFEAQG